MNRALAAISENEAARPTPDAIMKLGSAFWGSKTLLSAVELGLFSELAASGPLAAEELRDRLGLHERSARDFFDALVALGMLERGDEAYRNTPATERFLDRAKPSYVGGMLEMQNARLFGFWNSLTEALRTGNPQNEAKTGGDVSLGPVSDRHRHWLRRGVRPGRARSRARPPAWRRLRPPRDGSAVRGVRRRRRADRPAALLPRGLLRRRAAE